MVLHKWRSGLVYWLYAIAFTHWVVGVLLTWFMRLSIFADYNHQVLSKFWPSTTPAGALELQVWWISLFGATLQNFSLFMLLLIYLGHRLRLSLIWGWMIIGIVLWAPQDMWISAQRELWVHLWVDSAALLIMLPPLFLLWRFDRKQVQ